MKQCLSKLLNVQDWQWLDEDWHIVMTGHKNACVDSEGWSCGHQPIEVCKLLYHACASNVPQMSAPELDRGGSGWMRTGT